jgi:4-methylaminobutanoate oxidase (formaldehyde-forming)
VSVPERGISVAPCGALREFTVARGALWVTRDGWQVPARFGDAAVEAAAAREAVAVGERCGARVVELLGGPGIAALSHAWAAGKTPIGTACCLGEGGSRGLTLWRWCRLAPDHARLLGEAGSETPPVPDEIDVTAVDLSSGFTTLVVMGPKSADLLARLIRVDLDPRVFGDRRLALTGAAGVPLQVLRWDRGGVLAWELLVGRDVAEYFAETLERAGEGLGLRWIGEEAFAAVAGGEE